MVAQFVSVFQEKISKSKNYYKQMTLEKKNWCK